MAIWLYGDIKGSAWAKVLGVTIASIDVHAYARFHGCGRITADGTDISVEIRKIMAKAGFKWRIKIGCIEFSGTAEFEVIVIDKGACGKSRNSESFLTGPVSHAENGTNLISSAG